MGDKTRGLYGKFEIYRTDGKDEVGEKHASCDYFVLDLTHDPFAIPALQAYVDACRDEYPLLAADLEAKLSVCDSSETTSPDSQCKSCKGKGHYLDTTYDRTGVDVQCGKCHGSGIKPAAEIKQLRLAVKLVKRELEKPIGPDGIAAIRAAVNEL